ncbi:MAG: hypothetical protein J6O23_01700 [Prevotella sp.]|nr:hypothetical protein [Prevotella sp.]
MKQLLLFYFFIFFPVMGWAQPETYTWTTPSKNASESMPCGGGDVGLNVWCEDGDVLFYLSRSGCFDENNTLLKLGRFRIHLTNPFTMQSFRQQLVLRDGYCQVTDGQRWIQIWVDIEKPVVHVEVSIEKEKTGVEVTYESWRTRDRVLTSRERFQSSYKFAAPKGLITRRDSIIAAADGITFFHQNGPVTIFDATVSQQRMDAVKDRLYNPLKNLVFGGRMHGDQFVFSQKTQGRYASTDFEGWTYVSRRPSQRHALTITMATVQGSIGEWQSVLAETERQIQTKRDCKVTRDWWHQFWQRSYISLTSHRSPLTAIVRNYTLFRYMLACNSRGQWPTKFNGGLFTFDPEYVNSSDDYRLSPDFRNWGGGVHTAQNQRLVYWPMLKNGDYDLLLPQLDFYLNIYKNAEERSRLYWGHEGACLTEQIENYGLPCFPEYGTKRPDGFDPGMERNAWLEYEWDTCLEFCMMTLEAHRYCGMDITKYIPMIRSCLTFFDEHYQWLANRRSAKRLDGNGHLVLYPGSGGETFKGAYNSTSTIAALRTVAQALMDYEGANGSDHSQFLSRLPSITVRDSMIQPALHYERVQNVETTQLYPVFPWRMYGVGRPGLDIARNTYQNDTLALKFRSHVGWKQDAIWAACLGLTDEARRLVTLKLGDGPHRFPAFWGPGYDWTPDHNWGGSGMIALQEMLLQEVGDTLYLFPAWPREWDVRFRLHASRGTVVEAELRQGHIVNVTVTPASRQKDIAYP